MQFNSISYTWNVDGIKEEKKKDLKVTISPSPQLLVQNGMLIRVVISPHQKLVELLKSTNPAIIIETFTGIALIAYFVRLVEETKTNEISKLRTTITQFSPGTPPFLREM